MSDLLFGYTQSVHSSPFPYAVPFPGFFPNQTAANASAPSLLLTGADSPPLAHQLVRYHGQSTLYTCPAPDTTGACTATNRTVWATAAASIVSGSDGSVFPRPRHPRLPPPLLLLPPGPHRRPAVGE